MSTETVTLRFPAGSTLTRATVAAVIFGVGADLPVGVDRLEDLTEAINLVLPSGAESVLVSVTRTAGAVRVTVDPVTAERFAEHRLFLEGLAAASYSPGEVALALEYDGSAGG